ncbi:unnamed protein product [Thlaspi arvense]|uniref:Uncharacterized protein n=1 Tax=Thlaspi arvense TaxID=13288 RepID=A0AAU9R5A4_THLAR|nr:unnamed protein product [Thlaspi arvense]
MLLLTQMLGSSPLLVELVWSFNLPEGWDGLSFIFIYLFIAPTCIMMDWRLYKVESDLRITSTGTVSFRIFSNNPFPDMQNHVKLLKVAGDFLFASKALLLATWATHHRNNTDQDML